MNEKTISVVVLSCDSQLNKNGSLLLTLKSIIYQKGQPFELVLVDNSKKIDPQFTKDAEGIIKSSAPYMNGSMSFKNVRPGKQLSRGAARNMGVSAANGEIIIFLEDDTLLASDNVISKTVMYATESRYGFGARRDWISGAWIQKHITKMLNTNRDAFFADIGNASYDFKESLRNKDESLFGYQSFIGNFGFCYKKDFVEVGGFPDFLSYGYEDDHLMYKLFLINGFPKIMNDIVVVHYDHPVSEPDRESLIKHFKLMNDNGHYWFHSLRLFDSPKQETHNSIVEPLGSLHYDEDVNELFSQYQKLLPLDISETNDEVAHRSWRKNQAFSIMEMARQLHILSQSNSIDEYVKNSSADFDNIALVIKLAIENGVVTISKDGVVSPIKKFRFTEMPSPSRRPKITPDAEYNQFPCDLASVRRRYTLLKERYPYAEYLRIAILGDDDLLSATIKDAYWIDAEIIEKDPKIIKAILASTNRFRVLKHDIASLKKPADGKPVKTFITDPPYTYGGALAFILCGLQMLETSDDDKEFYVVLNPTMLGKHLNSILATLATSGVQLIEVRKNFAQYKLPANFDERKRADNVMVRYNIDKTSLAYSSSSDLYIFRTTHPNIHKIQRAIDPDSMYVHYLDI